MGGIRNFHWRCFHCCHRAVHKFHFCRHRQVVPTDHTGRPLAVMKPPWASYVSASFHADRASLVLCLFILVHACLEGCVPEGLAKKDIPNGLGTGSSASFSRE